MSYSNNGTWSQDNLTNGNNTLPATYYTGSWGAGASGYNAGGQYSVDASVSGTVTATCSWVPGTGFSSTQDPPPSQVIIKATASAYAAGGAGIGPPYASNGLGPDQSDTLYSVKDGSSGTITLSDTLSARTPSAGPPPYNGANARADASFSVTPYPVTVQLSGVTTDSNNQQNILVGQGCTAGIQGIPTECNVPSYSWTVQGNTFQSWVVTYVSNVSSTATLSGGLGPTTNPTAHWYWSDTQHSENVQCTATVSPPTGDGATFTVTPSANAMLLVPLYTQIPAAGSVVVSSGDPYLQGVWSLWLSPPQGETQGISWAGSVTTPPLFTAGVWNYVQTVSGGYTRTDSNGAVQSNPSTPTSGLDSTYPYQPPPYSATTPGTIPADGTGFDPGDTPGTSLSDSYVNYTANPSFNTYLMFRPPGSDVQWVPLGVINWNWTANINIPSTPLPKSWSNWGTAPYTNPAGAVTAPTTQPITTHPTWTTLALAQNWPN